MKHIAGWFVKDEGKTKGYLNGKIGKALLLALHALIKKAGRLPSAFCPKLAVASPGRILVQAKKNIAKALRLCLESVRAVGDE